jgi:hypothetical protein
LRREPFRDIQLPECIHEYAAFKKTSGQRDVEQATTINVDVDKLDGLLEKLDPKLKRRRQGAWQAFRSDNPDRLSQAANSMVELLDQVIGMSVKTQPSPSILKVNTAQARTRNGLMPQRNGYQRQKVIYIEQNTMWTNDQNN